MKDKCHDPGGQGCDKNDAHCVSKSFQSGSHIKFGKGVVKNIMDGGRDYEVTVDFEGYGVKKMFASFAKLKRI